jgi:hypothetical protein
MTDYIRTIINLLEKNGIDITNYDDDLTYFDEFDDVYVLNIRKNLTLKFIQNYYSSEKKYKNFTLYYDGKVIKDYDNIINELKNVLKIIK